MLAAALAAARKLRLAPLALALAALLAACPKITPPAATLAIAPASLEIPAGAVPQSFSVTVSGGEAEEVTWTLAGPGSVAPGTGPTTAYTPPPSVPGPQRATLTARLGKASASAAITVTPVSPVAGNLSVLVSGLDEPGAEADLTVSGPGGYRATLTASRTLLELAPGDYTLTARAVRVRQGELEAVREPELACALKPQRGATPALAEASCTATVAAGETAFAALAYQTSPGSGRLYVPSYMEAAVAAFDAAQLASSSSEPPAVLIGGTTSAQGLAFDAGGNLWVSDWDANALRKYEAAQLLASASPEPAVVLSATGGLQNPTALAFDLEGNLWVSNRGNATVVKFGAAQLAASGSPAPEVTLRDDGSGNLDGPTGLAFDAGGRLWFANAFSASLYRYDDPGSLTGDGAPSPDAVISGTITGEPSLQTPIGLAFDASGDLWVSDQGANRLVMFTPAQLEPSGTPLPTVTLSGLSGPGGLAFDAAGNLWVANGGAVAKFAAEQLAASGSPAPAVVLSGLGGIDLGFLAFNPPPSSLPLYGARP